MIPVVHVAEIKDFSPEVIARLRRFADVKTNDVKPDGIAAALNDCDVFWFRLGFRITREVLDKNTRCRFIVCPVTGLDHIDVVSCAEAGIKILSLRGEREFLKTVRATAEHAIGLALALMRKTCSAVRHVNAGGWNRDLFKGWEIFGKTVGILGVGRLGAIVAGYYKAFGADVCGYDINSYDTDTCRPVGTIEELFRECDIVTLHLSYTPATRHLVDKRLLGLMKAHAILINTARGGVLESSSLLWALQEKIIAGAALDVIEDEFDVSGNALVRYAAENDNLIITPHIGGNTFESFLKTEMFLCDRLEQFYQMRND